MAEEQSVNIPQLLLVILLGGLAIKYLFFSSPAVQGSNVQLQANNVRAREADVERIQQMFPQIPRRSLMWDLQRNGGNVVATTERILSGRGLESPPQTFQPPLPVAATTSSTSTGSTASSTKALSPDLITRYNLASKMDLAQPEYASVEETQSVIKKQAWSQNKDERQALLQRRREEMILAARRKMEAKVAAESAAAANVDTEKFNSPAH